ncbi:site-2 protease family protein [Streptomyces sp. M600PL45_2]|uniref:Site-2 protease family protein n=1 Tax=Streptomyces marispadix TaxID=2922868 RepID=A0ABS9SSQ9_9ACTN|nr:site-2 protease family protein [Streptomyces marispadix]MCH6159315.1 site-2 protease family protein [Streptomyces marispadix]
MADTENGGTPRTGGSGGSDDSGTAREGTASLPADRPDTPAYPHPERTAAPAPDATSDGTSDAATDTRPDATVDGAADGGVDGAVAVPDGTTEPAPAAKTNPAPGESAGASANGPSEAGPRTEAARTETVRTEATRSDPNRTPPGGSAPAKAPDSADTSRSSAPGTGTGRGDSPGPRAAAEPTPEPAPDPTPEPALGAPDPASPSAPGPLGAEKPRRVRPFGGGLLMGRPFGVPVYVAPSWFLVAALITWVFGGQLDRVLPHLGAVRYLIALFFAVAFYASVLVHELAHTVAALRFQLPVRRIQLQFFGGVSEIEKEAESPGREFMLAFVGPLLSLLLAAVFYAGMQAVRPGTVPGVLLAGLMTSNLIVAVFNLLPGLPLDGGRMLRALVWKLTGRPMTGTVFAAWIGRALAVAVLIGLPLATHAGGLTPESIGGVDSIMDALLAAILAAIIWTGAGNSLRMARLREHLPELRARNLTRRAVPVPTNTPLSEALRRANDAGARALVVVDGAGAPMALVREAAIAGVPSHRRPWVAVSSLAQELKEGMRVPAELAGEELLEYLRATPATEYLVVEETGEIYGVLSTGDVERAFVAAMAKPSA